MTEWKKKSINNLKGAELLIKNSLPTVSIHSSYYSNIQLMLHILHNDFNKTEEQIDIESKKGSRKRGFHNWLKNIITKELKNKNSSDIRSFNNFFTQIKKLRISADYKNIMVSAEKAKAVLELSKEISRILEKNFIT